MGEMADYFTSLSQPDERHVEIRRLVVDRAGHRGIELEYPAYTGFEPCTQQGHEVFFGEDVQSREEALAKQVCEGCPMVYTCGEWAISAERYGIWGGMTASERRKVRKARKQFLVDPLYRDLYEEDMEQEQVA